MEKQSVVNNFNSPIIQKNTPIKRLGLSRKRKSTDPVRTLNSKIQACGENFPASADESKKESQENEVSSPVKNSGSEIINSETNYDEEIDSLQKRIAEGEEKLKSLETVHKNITQLEELIEIWKNGCKNAFLHFRELIKERHEDIDLKSLLNKLGIWEVMVENFGNDTEVSLTEN